MQRRLSLSSVMMAADPELPEIPRNIPVAQPELLSYIFHNAIHVIHVPVTSHRAPHNLPEMHSGWGLAFE